MYLKLLFFLFLAAVSNLVAGIPNPCNSSQGFRLLKNSVENSVSESTLAGQLAVKLKSGEELSEDEYQLYVQTYKKTIDDAYKSLKQSFSQLRKGDACSLKIVCIDQSEALDFVINGGKTPDEAAQIAFNSTALDVRLNEQAIFKSSSKSWNRVLTDLIQNDFSGLRLNRKALPDSLIEKIRREPRSFINRLNRSGLEAHLEFILPPDQYALLEERISLSDLHLGITGMEKGEGGLFAYKETISTIKPGERLKSEYHQIYVHCISDRTLLLFDSLSQKTMVINKLDDLPALKAVLSQSHIEEFEKAVKYLKQKYELPETFPNREEIIQIAEKRFKEKYGLLTTAKIEDILFEEFSLITHR